MTRSRSGQMDIKTDFVGWNRGMESKLDAIYSANGMQKLRGADLLRHPDSVTNLIADNPDCQESMRRMKREMCVLQRDLSRFVVNKSDAQEDFEGKWQALPPTNQEEHILEGIRRTCFATSDFVDRRLFVLEVRTSLLMKQRGRPFLDLLRSAIILTEDCSLS
ncbi:hypothetical protein JAAARDRAFT_202680 [Jaapia argillacea MUCL 33604]|uniref:Uncharacterized protein n=1 Tax=Jaapia argillacea MUCL 33604 TaxID=933084 RepID=A0A067Q886_9AGAM|nr:hypothetical protein JAAARDRAFT_202680 [Jaapia argillacea MUCL 33604]